MSNMTFDTVSISSEDDVPLHTVGASLQKHPLSFGLRTHSLQNCDFCEDIALNRYDALVHNAKHIIIPLIKQKVHQCPLCLYYFTSMYKLKHHTRNKHKNDVVKPTNKTIDVKQKNDNTKDILVKTKDTTDKTKDLKGKESDDDDLPLIVHEKSKSKTENHVIKETDNSAVVIFDNDIIEKAKEKLLKDVKVVLDKIEIDKIDHKIVINPYIKVVNNENIKVVNNQMKVVNKNTKVVNNHNLKEDSAKTEPKPIKADHNVKVPDKVEPKTTNNMAKASDKIESKPNTITKDSEVKINSYHNAKTSNETDHAKPTIPEKEKISSRLRFEDDIDINICDDEILKDLTTDCIVDMNLFDQPWLDQIDQLAKSIADDDLVVEDRDVDVVTIDDSDDEISMATVNQQNLLIVAPMKELEEYSPSLHHEELIKPGVYRCKRCPETFPTRFNAIQHEMQHIHIRKPRPLLCEHCERFIPTKKEIQEHTMSKHRMVYRQRPYKNCQKCGLKYNNLHKHQDIYHHTLRCHLCNQGFDTDVERLNHIRGHLIKIKCGQCDFVATEIEIQEHQKFFHKVSVCVTKTFNLCELCCLFLKNKNNMQYVFGDTVSKLGTRLVCEHCGNKFFHLTQVKRYGKHRKEERFMFEKEKEKKKVCSNTERLKNIQQRLKMINKLSRF